MTFPALAEVGRVHTERPRVLLIPNVSGWILGAMARQIMINLGDQFEFLYISELVARRQPSLLRQLIGEADVIHALSESGAELVMKVRDGDSPPLVTSVHHIVDESDEILTALAHSEALVAATEGWAATIRAHSAVSAPVHVVRYGVDHRVFVPTDTRKGGESRNRTSRFTVGFVGSATSNDQGGRKGLDTLETVARRVAQAEPRLHIVFLGIGWDAEVAKLRACGVSCETLGFVPDSKLPAFYASIDAYLVTARVEGGPCPVLEAMACGVPVVATRVGLVGETIVDGVTGLSADANDPESLAQSLVTLATNVEMRSQLGSRARDRIEQTLGWDTTLEPLRAIYQGVATAERHGLAANRRVHRRNAAEMRRAVASADGLVWATALVRRRRAGMREGIKMLRALWSELALRDHIAGIRLLLGKPFPVIGS